MDKRKASILFIFVTITLDMIGIGLIIPSLPGIMRRFTDNPELVSQHYGYFIATYAALQFLASPLLGALSDLYGRRPVLLVSLCMAGLDYLLMAFAPTLPILYIGRVISGLTGASITVAMAYIADVSDVKSRARNFGMMGAAFGLGFIIGPAIGGLLGGFGPEYPFLVAAALNLLNFVFGAFVLPESLPRERRRALSRGKLNPLLSLKKIFSLPNILVLAAVHFLFGFAGNTHPSVWVLYTQHRFQWTSAQVGASLALVGILSAIAQGWLTGKIVPKLGEMRTVFWGSIVYAITYAAFGAATTSWMLYAILIITSPSWVANPALQSLITKDVPPEEQGELQGSLVSLTSLAAILNPLLMTQVFAHFSGPAAPVYLPGAPYFLAGLTCLTATALLLAKHLKS